MINMLGALDSIDDFGNTGNPKRAVDNIKSALI